MNKGTNDSKGKYFLLGAAYFFNASDKTLISSDARYTLLMSILGLDCLCLFMSSLSNHSITCSMYSSMEWNAASVPTLSVRLTCTLDKGDIICDELNKKYVGRKWNDRLKHSLYIPYTWNVNNIQQRKSKVTVARFYPARLHAKYTSQK